LYLFNQKILKANFQTYVSEIIQTIVLIIHWFLLVDASFKFFCDREVTLIPWRVIKHHINSFKRIYIRIWKA